MIATILQGPQLRHSPRNCRNSIFRSPTRVPSSPVFSRQIYCHGILPWNTGSIHICSSIMTIHHQGHVSPSRINREIKRPSMRFQLLTILSLPLASLISTLRRGLLDPRSSSICITLVCSYASGHDLQHLHVLK